MKPIAISTFSGIGGSSLGYKRAGFNVIGCIEINKHAVDTYRMNHPNTHVFHGDITKIQGKEILETLNIKKGDLDLLDGSPPCQGFSALGKRCLQDDRNRLFLSFFRLVDELGPKNIVIENVAGMIQGKMKYIAHEILIECKKRGYKAICGLVKASSFGVAQYRPRVFFIGSREGNPFFPILHNRIVTCEEALVGIKARTFPENKSKYHKFMMDNIKEGKDGASLMLSLGKKRKHWGAMKISRKKPAFTIKKTYTGYYHWNNRTLSIEEALVLTGFPENYKMIGKFREKWAGIGNSVCPPVTKAIGEMLLSIMKAKDLTG